MRIGTEQSRQSARPVKGEGGSKPSLSQETWTCPHCEASNPKQVRGVNPGEVREPQLCRKCSRYKWDVKAKPYVKKDKDGGARLLCERGHKMSVHPYEGYCPDCKRIESKSKARKGRR